MVLVTDRDVVAMTVHQTRPPLPSLTCVDDDRCCFQANETHFLTAGGSATAVTATVRNGSALAATLHRAASWSWSSDDHHGHHTATVRDPRWPYCKDGGGLERSGLDLPTTCAGLEGVDAPSPSPSSMPTSPSTLHRCMDLCVDRDGLQRQRRRRRLRRPLPQSPRRPWPPRVICSKPSSHGKTRERERRRGERATRERENGAGGEDDDDDRDAKTTRGIDRGILRIARWLDRANGSDPDWSPWRAEKSVPSGADAVVYDTAVLYWEDDPGNSYVYHRSAAPLLEIETGERRRLCVRPTFPRRANCHAMVHGACYLFQWDDSVQCFDVSRYPAESKVTIRWAPTLTRSPLQPGPSAAHSTAFCLAACGGVVDRFLACVDAASASTTFAFPGIDAALARVHRTIRGRASTISVAVVRASSHRPSEDGNTAETTRTLLWAIALCYCAATVTAAALLQSHKHKARKRVDALAWAAVRSLLLHRRDDDDDDDNDQGDGGGDRDDGGGGGSRRGGDGGSCGAGYGHEH